MYIFLRLLNKRQSVFVKVVVIAIVVILLGLFVRRVLLLRQISRDLYFDRSILAVRRAVWALQLMTPLNKIYAIDANFNFTKHLCATDLIQTKKIIFSRNAAIKKSAYLRYVLLIEAALLHSHIDEYGAIKSSDQFENTLADLIDLEPTEVLPKLNHKKNKQILRRNAIAALKDFKRSELLQNKNWYIISGTLLGCVRENSKFLEHDYDLDFGVNAEDFDLNLFQANIQKCRNFTIKRIDYSIEVLTDTCFALSLSKRISLVKILHKTGVEIDLFIHYRENSYITHGTILNKWCNNYFTLKAYELEGVCVLGPADADTYLTENYGDWRTPLTNFSSSIDTPNLSVPYNYVSLATYICWLAILRDQNDGRANQMKIRLMDMLSSNDNLSIDPNLRRIRNRVVGLLARTS